MYKKIKLSLCSFLFLTVLLSFFIFVDVGRASAANTLYVKSSPVTGVSIGGTYSGTTDYTKSSSGNIFGTLVAPDPLTKSEVIYSFSSWSGCDSVDGRICTVGVSNNGTKTVTANYKTAKSSPCGSYGNINGDTKVTYIDSEWILQFVSGLRTFSTSQIENADVDDTPNTNSVAGDVTSADATNVQAYINGSISSFPVCGLNTLLVASSPVTGAKISGTYPGTTNYNKQSSSTLSGTITASSTVISGGVKYNFSSWSGCGSVSGGSCTVSVSGGSTKTVTANYSASAASSTNTLKVSSSPVLAVPIGGDYPGTTNYTTSTTSNIYGVLTARPFFTSGGKTYGFSSWSGCTSVSGIACIVNASWGATQSVTAKYAINTLNVKSYPITNVSFVGSHSGKTNYTKTSATNIYGTFAVPPSVVINGIVYKFSSWLGCGSTSGTFCIVSVSGGNTKTVTANYSKQAANTRSLAVLSDGVATVQGLKVMPGHISDPVKGLPAINQTVYWDGSPWTSSNPYFVDPQPYTTHTVSVGVPAGYRVGYTLCVDNIDCHSNTPIWTNSVTFKAGAAGSFVDLWWHYQSLNTCGANAPRNLYNEKETGIIYVVTDDCQKRRISDPNAFNGCFYDWNSVQQSDKAAMDTNSSGAIVYGYPDCPEAPKVSACGIALSPRHLYNEKETGIIYVLTDSCQKRRILDPAAFNSCNYDWNRVEDANQYTLNTISQGANVSAPDCPAAPTVPLPVTASTDCIYDKYTPGSGYGYPKAWCSTNLTSDKILSASGRDLVRTQLYASLPGEIANCFFNQIIPKESSWAPGNECSGVNCTAVGLYQLEAGGGSCAENHKDHYWACETPHAADLYYKRGTTYFQAWGPAYGSFCP